MSDHRGYDDLFNEGLLTAAVRGSRAAYQPVMPRSLTALRHHTTVSVSEPLAYRGWENSQSDFLLRRPYSAQHAGVPGASIIARHWAGTNAGF